MEQKTSYTFEEIPVIMADVAQQLRALNEKVESLSSGKSVRSRNDGPFIPSHRVVLTTATVCKILHKNRQAIYRLVATGDIPYFKQGKNLGFFEDDFYNWLEQQKKNNAVILDGIDADARDYCMRNNL